ncbi:LysR family transcriptional regulator [Nitrincola sp. MINF-07-Sa-05]|uniref:LysR family transcriptional regulator n=1 Tax=Nitrincola salilacus TaxID=3400273 RepID=UPI0039185274
MSISIRHLQAFVEIASSGSFTRAAEHLHLTQSTLTATIKQLEEQAELTLLDRTTRRVFLTQEGERFLPVAQRLLSDFRSAMEDLRATSLRQQGHVGLAASPSMLTRLLPAIVKHFATDYPGISLYLRDDGAGGIEQRVLDNEVDFGLASNHSRQPELNYEPVLRDRYGVVVPQEHPLVTLKQPLQWSQVRAYPLILLSSDTGIRAQLEGFSAQGVAPVTLETSLLEVSNPAGLAALISEGLGISIIPALAADTSSFERLRFIPLNTPLIEREICIITRRKRSLTPAAESLLKYVRDGLAKAQLPASVRFIG